MGLVQALLDLDAMNAKISSPALQQRFLLIASDILWFGSTLALFAPRLAAVDRARRVEEDARRKAEAQDRGKASGIARRQKVETGWKRIALKHARSARSQNPALSQDDLATEIQAMWKDDSTLSPGHATLKDLISDAEKQGELPRRSGRRKRSVG
jgi:hypothetical protein